MQLTGRVALVTGGSRGIGRAIAVALAEAGATVAVNYHARRDDALATVETIIENGGNARALRADVRSPAQVASLVRRVEARLGGIDILVNNAGIAQPVPLDQVNLPRFDAAIQANLRSAFLVTTAALPGMRRRRWGRLIFLSSVAAFVGGVVGPHYAASKAGMDGLMRSYASLLAKEGITSNSICPALIQTDMVAANPRATPALIPIGRFGAPDEVASAAVLLATNGYITGQCLHVNGGMYFT